MFGKFASFVPSSTNIRRLWGLINVLSNKVDTLVPSDPVTWTTLSGKPAVIAAGVDAPAARTAIGAGTSSLAIGTTGTTAKAGNYVPTAAEVSAALKVKTQVAALTSASTAADIVAALQA